MFLNKLFLKNQYFTTSINKQGTPIYFIQIKIKILKCPLEFLNLCPFFEMRIIGKQQMSCIKIFQSDNIT